MNPLYVGIDVSSKSNVVYFMLPNGDKHSNFSVANSHDGSTQLVKRICSALTSEALDTYNDLPKNDWVDSFVIADCLRFGRINKEVYIGDYHYKALQYHRPCCLRGI